MSKNRNVIVSAGAALLLLVALVAGCSDVAEPPDSSTGSLHVDLNTGRAKTIWPVGWKSAIGEYHVLVFAGDANPQTDDPLFQTTVTPENSGDTIVFAEVPEGSYQVVIAGFCAALQDHCAAGDLLAVGMADELVVVVEDQIAAVSITVSPLLSSEDPGAMEISLSWPESPDITVSQINVYQKPIDGEWPETPSQVFTGTDLSEFLVTYVNPSVAPGSHLVAFALLDAESEMLSTAIEAVGVYSNYTTTGMIVLLESDFRIVEPVPPPEGYDLNILVNWDGGGGSTLYFPNTSEWELLEAPALFLDPAFSPDWEITLPYASDIAGVVEFQVLQNGRAWADCWDFAGWTILNATLGTNTCQLIVDCSGVADLVGIRVLVEKGAVMGQGTVTAQCVVPERKGQIYVDFDVFDPTEGLTDPLGVDCTLDGESLRCWATGGAGLQSPAYAWYVNGVRQQGANLAEVWFEGLVPQDRITLVARGTDLAMSAQLTVTGPMLGIFPPRTMVVRFDFASESQNAVEGNSTITREPVTSVGYQYPGEASLGSNNWTTGSGTKYWVISFTTTGLSDLWLSSEQLSANNGPRDFKVQYLLDGSSEWVDVPGAILVLSSTWGPGTIVDLPLPAECANQPTLSLRWIMTSNNTVDGSTFSGAALSRIRDIVVTGMVL